MKKDKRSLLFSVAEAIAAPKVSGCHISTTHTRLGDEIFDGMSKGDLARLKPYEDAALRAIFHQVVHKLTKPKPPWEASDPTLFDLEEWISSATMGERIQYGDADWEDHMAHRENQLESIARSANAFAIDEAKRKKLGDAGMRDEPKMTTTQAIECIGRA